MRITDAIGKRPGYEQFIYYVCFGGTKSSRMRSLNISVLAIKLVTISRRLCERAAAAIISGRHVGISAGPLMRLSLIHLCESNVEAEARYWQHRCLRVSGSRLL